jgi:hypothetical protein
LVLKIEKKAYALPASEKSVFLVIEKEKTEVKPLCFGT